MALRSAKNIGIALAFATLCLGQSTTISLYQQTAPVASANFNNINPRYNAWTVMYNYSGSGSFSIELDCAPDATTAGGTPTAGSFAACTNVKTGNNPSATPNYGYMTFVGYTPWLKLNLTAISSGNMTAVAVGFTAADPESGGGSGGCVGTTGTPCIVAGPTPAGSAPTKNPVMVAGIDGTDVRTLLTDATGRLQVLPSTDGNPQPIIAGTSQAAVSISSGTDVVVVTGTSSKKTHITKLDLSWDNSAIVTIREGTTVSTPCDTTTVALSGGYNNLVALFEDYGSDFAALTTTVNADDICLHFSTSVTGGGQVFYSVF
jgi:hypothetical protein